jgi:hypothetical protein
VSYISVFQSSSPTTLFGYFLVPYAIIIVPV